MPLDLAPGVEVHVDVPAVPPVQVAPPRTDVAVVPVQGPPGPPGAAGGGYLRHEQATPTTVATVVHGFGRWPAAVALTSLDGSETYDEYGVQHLDVNTVRITTDTPTAYVALIL